MKFRTIARCVAPFSIAVLAAPAWVFAVGRAYAGEAPPMPTPPTGRAGSVVIVDQFDPTKLLRKGGSAARFSLRLPEGATCPGDSVHDQWRFQTFLVPANDDPSRFAYGVVGAIGNGRQALYSLDTRGVVNMNLRRNTEAGRPATVPVPVMTFAVYARNLFANGSYRLGVACTYFGRTNKFWDTTITIVNTPKDQPAGFRWTATGQSVVGSSSATTSNVTTDESAPTSSGESPETTLVPPGSIDQVLVTDPAASGSIASRQGSHRSTTLIAIVVALIATALVAALVLFWPRRSGADSTSRRDPS